MKVKVGDKVSEGDVIASFEAGGGDAKPEGGRIAEKEEKVAAKSEGTKREDKPRSSAGAKATEKGERHAELLVLGAGPGGYTAAFRAADLGLKVVLVDSRETLGGVCLNVGCIPSKALLHAAKVIGEGHEMAANGIRFGEPEIDIDKLRSWKDGVVGKLVGGLGGLAKQRKVEWVKGYGRFTGPHMLEVEEAGGKKSTISFDQAIIAAGSEPIRLPFVPHDDPRVMDSTGALELADIPKRLLVLGGGIIGLEMACVYQALGSKVSVVELMDQLMPGADKDIVAPLHKRVKGLYENIWLETKVTNVEARKEGLKVSFEGKGAPASDTFDRILVAVGRKPNGGAIGADKAGVKVDERGFIAADSQMRTNVDHIFAIGDLISRLMLAHKAVHEGKTAAEAAAGKKSHFDAKVIPSVAYTDPEVAWVGLTETQAKAEGRTVGKGVFPWAASGRALANDRAEGMTKLIFDPETDRLLGAAIVGVSAGDLIAEAVLAIEMGADAQDIGLTVHPHPTLSESVGMAAEMFEGTITDLMPPKKREKK
ncbi:MAG: dihydrolipoyl dehydrogenase [Geminicoccaceae bacterium]|nr:dihydrolipoyl dehydrogenase [Geminicoccaceae bacterium]